jgi:hypothetical protein
VQRVGADLLSPQPHGAGEELAADRLQVKSLLQEHDGVQDSSIRHEDSSTAPQPGSTPTLTTTRQRPAMFIRLCLYIY